MGSPFSAGKSLSSFASPSAKPLQSEKPAKPFGAPESDAEDEDDEDADRDGESESDEQERAASPEREPEEKKRFKLHKGETVFPKATMYIYMWPHPALSWRRFANAAS